MKKTILQIFLQNNSGVFNLKVCNSLYSLDVCEEPASRARVHMWKPAMMPEGRVGWAKFYLVEEKECVQHVNKAGGMSWARQLAVLRLLGHHVSISQSAKRSWQCPLSTPESETAGFFLCHVQGGFPNYAKHPWWQGMEKEMAIRPIITCALNCTLLHCTVLHCTALTKTKVTQQSVPSCSESVSQRNSKNNLIFFFCLPLKT